jgi:hypothetical protein
LGIFAPGDDGDGPAQETDGLGSGGATEFYSLFRDAQQAVNMRGADFLEFAGNPVGPMVFFQPDEVKIVSEEGGEAFSTGPVEVFPQEFEFSRDFGVIVRG